MPYKYGKRTREFLGAFLFPFQSSFPLFSVVFNKTIIPLALVGYEMIIANSALRTSFAIYHLISNKREWNTILMITRCAKFTLGDMCVDITSFFSLFTETSAIYFFLHSCHYEQNSHRFYSRYPFLSQRIVKIGLEPRT